MSSIIGTNSSAYTNPYSSASRRAAEEEEEEDRRTNGAAGSDEADTADAADGADKTEETPRSEEETKTLNEYKKDFLAQVKTLMLKPHLVNVGLELDISDAGFEKMMNDGSYEKSVLDRLKSKTAHSYTPLSGTVKLSADGTGEPSATMAESRTVSEILFRTSNKTLLKTLGIDAMMAMADETLASLETSRGRFSMAGQLGAMQMRSTSGYLDKYLETLNSLDTTG